MDEYIIKKDNLLELYTEEIELDEWNVPLRGSYQRYNAALAVLAITKTYLCDNNSKIMKGIEKVIENTGIKGRYEHYHKSPDVILDSAHNIAGVTEFLSEFDKESNKYTKKIVLFGAMRDKALDQMLAELNKSFDEIHLTEIDYERSAKIEDLINICKGLSINAYEEPDPVGFIKKFLKGNSESCLVVLGSMYLIGNVKINL